MYIVRVLAVWVLLLVTAIINGGFREDVLVPSLGQRSAQTLSGVTGSLLIFLCTYILIKFIHPHGVHGCIAIGGVWFFLTVGFEFVFGLYVRKRPLDELLDAYDPRTGNFWVLVLMVVFFSPFIAAKLRGLI